MQIIPLQPVPNQRVTVTLSNQNCTMRIYTLGSLFEGSALYLDLYVAGILLIGGVLCENGNVIVRDAYRGFIGDLGFLDNSGLGQDPFWQGLGDETARFSLAYLEPIDLNGAS